MKNEKSKLIYTVLLAINIASCSKNDLNQNPSASLSDATVTSSYEAAKTVLSGAYDQTGHYTYLTIGQIGLDVMGDDEMLSSGEYGFSTYNWNVFSYNYNIYSIPLLLMAGGVLMPLICGVKLITRLQPAMYLLIILYLREVMI